LEGKWEELGEAEGGKSRIKIYLNIYIPQKIHIRSLQYIELHRDIAEASESQRALGDSAPHGGKSAKHGQRRS